MRIVTLPGTSNVNDLLPTTHNGVNCVNPIPRHTLRLNVRTDGVGPGKIVSCLRCCHSFGARCRLTYVHRTRGVTIGNRHTTRRTFHSNVDRFSVGVTCLATANRHSASMPCDGVITLGRRTTILRCAGLSRRTPRRVHDFLLSTKTRCGNCTTSLAHA